MIFTLFTLAILEISLSFDNAIVNAAVLRKMPKYIQDLFLTVGWLIGVVGVRLLLPIIIIACSTGMGMKEVSSLAWSHPDLYSHYVQMAHDKIGAFGGTFLLLLFLSFLTNKDKLHWHGIERQIADFFQEENTFSINAIIIGLVIIIAGFILNAPLVPVLLGIITFTVIKLAGSFLEHENVLLSGVMGFLYLEILDASFSLDGVVAAFSITSNIYFIMIGLGIGSYAIRMFTVHMVRKNYLTELPYLEHGAMYAIGALGLLSFFTVPSWIPGLIAISIIGIGVIHSLKENEA